MYGKQRGKNINQRKYFLCSDNRMKNISNDDKYIIHQESLNVVFSVMSIG